MKFADYLRVLKNSLNLRLVKLNVKENKEIIKILERILVENQSLFSVPII